MAFPVAAVLAGASLLPALFGGKRKDVKTPEFANLNYEDVIKLIEQANQAQQGGAVSKIRNQLADAGILNPSTLTDAITQSNIQAGAGTAGQIAGLGASELGRAEDFQSQKYFNDVGIANQDYQQNRGAVTSLSSAIGKYFADKQANTQFERMLEYFTNRRGSVGGSLPTDFIGPGRASDYFGPGIPDFTQGIPGGVAY